jgi:hypothetical protein
MFESFKTGGFMTRDEKVDYLVDESMTRILEGNEDMLLMHYLLTGFVGFNNMTDEELDAEIEEIRALKAEEEDDR